MFLCQASLFAQNTTDTVPVANDFKVKSFIVPASLIVVGSLGVDGLLTPLNKQVNEKMDDIRCRKFHADDHIQYLPVVSVFGLSLAGAQAKHNYYERILLTATSWVVMGVAVNGVKYAVKEKRPDTFARNSFPSGHTATAFMGAELVRLEYGDESIWYSVAAYSVASAVGIMRIYNERHWLMDVVAGAGFGILSARIGYWLLPYIKGFTDKIFDKKFSLAIQPVDEEGQMGIGLSYIF
ncbi:phospholipid phosphatase [Bacteroidia bacterium]|nr:phospholipid phosphatase [Bacteroidia bacterium]